MFTEVLYMSECYLAVAKRLNIPIIATTACDLTSKYWAFLGYSFNPSIVPHRLSVHASKMTFVERLKNTFEIMYIGFIEDQIIRPSVGKIYQNYYPDIDPFDLQLSLVFYNNYGSIFPRPTAPSIIQIGGIHLKPQQPLPKVSKTSIFEVLLERGRGFQ